MSGGFLADVPWLAYAPAASAHGCWSGVSPPSHLLGKAFAWAPAAVTCELRNLCYLPEEETFEYFALREEQAAPPLLSVWSGSGEELGGGYEPPVKTLPLRLSKRARGGEPTIDLPVYVTVRSDSQNWGHVIYEMFLPLLTLMSQAEELGSPNGRRLLFFLDDCDQESVFNTPPAIPGKRRSSRATCERISSALTSVVSDFHWVDRERLRASGAERICFSTVYAGTGRWSWRSQPPAQEANGFQGGAMRLFRDWAYRRLAPGPLQDKRDVVALLRKPDGARRNMANAEEVVSWLRAWAEEHSLRFVELRLHEMGFAEQVQALRQVRLFVTLGGSSHTGASLLLPDWAAVIVVPQCGGCRPEQGQEAHCHVDTLYTRPCSVEEWGFDAVWPRPKLWLLWYPATMEDTVERAGHLDVIIGYGRLLSLLEESWLLTSQDLGSELEEHSRHTLQQRRLAVRLLHYSWPEILQTPLVSRCGSQDRQPAAVRTCATRLPGRGNNCQHVHKRYHDAPTNTAYLPSLAGCFCEAAQLEVARDASWNWRQLGNPVFLQQVLALHDLGLYEGSTIEAHTQVCFGQPYSAMGWYGHPSLLELLRRRAFHEDNALAESDCSGQEDCAFKRVLLFLEWILVGRNVVRDVVTTGDLGPRAEEALAIWAEHSRLVGESFEAILEDLDSPEWRPGLLVLLHAAQKALATDFASEVPVSPFSDACGGKVKTKDPRALPRVEAAASDRSSFLASSTWVATLCEQVLPQPTVVDADVQPVAAGQGFHPSSLRPFCRPRDRVLSLQAGPGLRVHVLGQELLRPLKGLFGGTAEVEVILFVQSTDGCEPAILDKATLLLSLPAAGLYSWQCAMEDGSLRARTRGVPVSLSGFVLRVVCPVAPDMGHPEQPLMVRLQAPLHKVDLPLVICPEVPRRKKKLAICLRQVYDLPGLVRESGVPTVLDDWFNFHLLAGVELFGVLDTDGSFREAAPHLAERPDVRYFPKFPEFLEVEGVSTEHQAMEHCVAALRDEAEWIALVPGVDVFLWSPRASEDATRVGLWAHNFVAALGPYRPDLAALHLSEVQLAAGGEPSGRSLFTRYQLRSPARRHTFHTSIINPENLLETTWHFNLPRPGALLVNVSDSVFRANHYVDFVVDPLGPSRCSDCDIPDDSLGRQMEELLRSML